MARKAYTEGMAAEDHVADWYASVGDALTRMTLDARAAVTQAVDQDSRGRAFTQVHLVRDVVSIFSQGVWTSPDEAAQAAARHVIAMCSYARNELPDWLHLVAARWSANLPQSST